jgi:hypothetical protein
MAVETKTDQELARAAARHNPAFTELYRRHVDRVCCHQQSKKASSGQNWLSYNRIDRRWFS